MARAGPGFIDARTGASRGSSRPAMLARRTKGCEAMGRTTVGLLVVAVLMALVAAGCNSSDPDTTANPPSSTVAPAPTTTVSAAPTSTTASGTAADCSNAVLLQAAQQALTESGSTATVTSVTLTRCRNGYALLSAHPASGGESPNVFLAWRPAAGAWEAIDLGTGIDCAGSPIGPKLTAACDALGY
jgi:hypothetical protein